MINCTITHNEAKNGIEIRFSAIPDTATREALKNAGFRWSRVGGCWYNKYNETTRAAAEKITGATTAAEDPKPSISKNKILSLWERVCTDDLPAYGTDNKLKTEARTSGESYDKTVAKMIRKHLRQRFPECKFSVTSGGAGWLMACDIDIVGGIYAVDSEELAAILAYCQKLHDAFDADDGDHYADYGAHHDLYGHAQIAKWNYTQTEATPAQLADIEEYKTLKKAKEEADHAEFIKKCEEEAAKRKEAAEREAIEEAANKAEILKIEASAIVEELQPENALYFNAFEARKVCTISDLEEEMRTGNASSTLCKVIKKVVLPSALIDKMKNLLMYDFNFISGEGGHGTNDPRINSDMDFMRMSEAERSSVQWYNICIAIIEQESGKIMFLVNPEGHTYCRYVYNIDSETNAPEIELTEDNIAAEKIEDISTEIIMNLGNPKEWQNSKEYAEAMQNSGILEYLTKSIIQRIKIIELKQWLYKAYDKKKSISQQFKSIAQGDKITICNLSCMGGCAIYSGEVFGVDIVEETAKIIIKPRGKKNGLQFKFKPSEKFIILSGLVDVPDAVLWECGISSTGLQTKKSRFASYDENALEAVKKYAVDHNITVAVDRLTV